MWLEIRKQDQPLSMMPLRDYRRAQSGPSGIGRRIDQLEKASKARVEGLAAQVTKLGKILGEVKADLSAIERSCATNQESGQAVLAAVSSLEGAVLELQRRARPQPPAPSTVPCPTSSARNATIHPLNYSNLQKWTELSAVPPPHPSDDDDGEDE